MDTPEFGARMLELLTGSALTTLVAMGHRTGLFDAAARGPATSAELAERAGLDERYVREWLGAMVTGGILDHGEGVFTLPAGHAPLLTGARAANAGPSAVMLRLLATVSPQVEAAAAAGAGVPYEAYAAHGPLGESWRLVYDEKLVDGFLGTVPGLLDRLRAGARVLDLGCGTGHAANLMGRAFPDSTIAGLDLAPEAIAAAEAERAAWELPNVAFTVGDAAELAPDAPYDVITAFDAVHDQQRPERVLRRVREALAPGGLFLMVDAKFASRLEDNLGNPHAALCYAISLLFCVPTSRAAGGPGLGAMWGQERAREMLADAGFADVTVLDSPRPQNCLYVCPV